MEEHLMKCFDVLRKIAKNGREIMWKQHNDLAGPWIIEAGEIPRLHAVATDARILLFVKIESIYESGFRELSSDIRDKITKRYMEFYKPKEPDLGAMRVSLADLRTFAGAAVWSEPCPACKGISKDNEYVVCSFCDSDGVTSPDPRYGYIRKQPCDLNRVAQLLEAFPDEGMVDIHHAGMALWFVTDTVRATLQGMAPQKDDEDEAAKWKVAPKFLGTIGAV
jgi:hypothetical protein